MGLKNEIFLVIIPLIICLIYSCERKEKEPIPIINGDKFITSNSFIIEGEIEGNSYRDYNFLISSDSVRLKKSLEIKAWESKNGGLKGYCYDLLPNTTYFSCLFAVKGYDTIFSDLHEVVTKPKLTITDARDSANYEYVKIGNQVWFSENVNYYIEGSSYYNNDSLKYSDKGRLYTFEMAQNVCPEGWHLPSDSDWKELEEYLGMPEKYINSFNRPLADQTGLSLINLGVALQLNASATNEFGFNMKPTGYYMNGSFDNINSEANFWTADTLVNEDGTAKVFREISNLGQLFRIESYTTCKLAVRCLQDKQ